MYLKLNVFPPTRDYSRKVASCRSILKSYLIGRLQPNTARAETTMFND